MFKIADQIFEIKEAEFFAHLGIGENGWAISWNLEFSAKERDIDGMPWQPKLSSHAFSNQLPDLYSLASSEIRLADLDEEDEPLFMFYLFEHEPVRNVMLKFGAWEGITIPIRFTGVADLYVDEKYGENVPFEISMTLPFEGVFVDENKPEKALEKFTRFFDASRFHTPEQKGPAGGHLFRPRQI